MFVLSMIFSLGLLLVALIVVVRRGRRVNKPPVIRTVKADEPAKPVRLIPVGGRRPKWEILPLTPETLSAEATCGHKQWQKTRLVIDGNVIGESDLPTFPNAMAGKPLEGRCLSCELASGFDKLASCVLCGAPIRPGDGVALYGGVGELTEEQIARMWKTEDGQMMGCLQWACCPSGGFYAGTFDGDAIRSPYMAGTQAAEVLRTGQAIAMTR